MWRRGRAELELQCYCAPNVLPFNLANRKHADTCETVTGVPRQHQAGGGLTADEVRALAVQLVPFMALVSAIVVAWLT